MMRILLVATTLLVAACTAVPLKSSPPVRPCDVASQAALPFCNQALPLEERVADLVSRLELSEKLTQFANGASAIPRLSIAPQQWWGEALHGVADSPSVNFDGEIKCATSFPQVIGTGATFNASLWYAIGNTISTEARAMANSQQAGTTFWSPVINQARDPRWGRLQETPGEDPLHIATYAAQFATAMQTGEDPHHLKVSSCCKHFIAYSLEDWHNMDRYHFDAITTPRDMADSYLPPFEGCVRNGQASSVMCSYNAVNGVPSCASKDLLSGIVREAWGFQGYITSDCDAVANVYDAHHYKNTTEETCQVTLAAGMDVDCGSFLNDNLQKAVSKGTVNEALLDAALVNLFNVRFRLGEFDSVASQPYLTYGPNRVATKEHQDLALQAARQSIVLLKNANSALPLAPTKLSSIAVVGPHADATTTLQGSYYGHACSLTSPASGMRAHSDNVRVETGCADVKCESTTGFAAATKAAEESDVAVVVVGLDQQQESEGHDRTDLSLPGHQTELVQASCGAAAKGKKKCVVVILSGGPVDVSDLEANDDVSAILWAGYPGQSGGEAIADVIFGKFNPGGRLPVTWYPQSFVNEASLFDMGMRPNATNGNPGRTYRFYTGKPVYAFGHGLSYTSFLYSTQLSQESVRQGDVQAVAANSDNHFLRGHKNDAVVSIVTVNVKNVGKVDGDDIVLLYAKPPGPPGMSGAPIQQLVGFERVFLKVGETKTLKFPVYASDLTLFNEDAVRETVLGEWQFVVGEAASTLIVQ